MPGRNQSLKQNQPMLGCQQTENLNHMYYLVDKLLLQIQQNKEQKDIILQNIDNLSRRLIRNPTRRSDNERKDIIIFRNFLINNQYGNANNDRKVENDAKFSDTNIISEDDANTEHNINNNNDNKSNENDDNSKNESDNVKILASQNDLLKRLLEQKKQGTEKCLINLQYHENSLSDVTNLLRRDSIKYENETIAETRKSIVETLFPCEDKEFEIYMDNISGMKSVYDMNSIYKELLHLLDLTEA